MDYDIIYIGSGNAAWQGGRFLRKAGLKILIVEEILFGGAVKDALTPVAAASLLVFSLLYTPCIAAIASIRRELGRKWAVGMVIWQCMIAWVAAFAVRWLMVLFMR